MNTRFHLWMSLKRLPAYALILGAGAAATHWGVSNFPLTYTATTEVMLQTPERPDTARGAEGTLLRHLATRPDVLAQLVQDLGLESTFGADATSVHEALRDSLVVDIIANTSDATILRARHGHGNAEIAQALTLGVAGQIIDEQKKRLMATATRQRQSLELSAARAEHALNTQSKRILEFTQTNSDLSPTAVAARTKKLTELQTQRASLLKVKPPQPTETSLAALRQAPTKTNGAKFVGHTTDPQPAVGAPLAEVEAQIAKINAEQTLAPEKALALETLREEEGRLASLYRNATDALSQYDNRINQTATSSIVGPFVQTTATSLRLKWLILISGALMTVSGLWLVGSFFRRSDRRIHRAKDISHGLGLTPLAVIPNFSKTLS